MKIILTALESPPLELFFSDPCYIVLVQCVFTLPHLSFPPTNTEAQQCSSASFPCEECTSAGDCLGTSSDGLVRMLGLFFGNKN